jgi:integrase
MATTSTFAAIATAEPVFTEPEQLALAGFLAGYTGLTREACALDLRQDAGWCAQHHVCLFQGRRAKPVGPHTLRHAFITAALDAGVSLRDVQDAASHADPRTTMRYDRARGSLDRHATYIVAAYIAGAAR